MQIEETGIPGLLIISPPVHHDDRGYFFESYSKQSLSREGVDVVFVQDNQASSTYGVMRGLHYQAPPYAQTKLVRALSGEILDVVVDIRKYSPAYGQVYSIILSADNKKQLLVPQGFAHGYAVLSPTAEVLYKCDHFYNKASEGGINLNDADLHIDWKINKSDQIISQKDLDLQPLALLQTPFIFS